MPVSSTKSQGPIRFGRKENSQKPLARSVLLRATRLKNCLGLVALCLSVSAIATQIYANPPAENELPSGGQITSGSGDISKSLNTLNVLQNSNKLIADWQTFNIGSKARVNFQQPDASSIALNRVRSEGASQIHGSLNANGQVFLVNPSGIVFSPSAQIDVGGLVASTLNITDRNFLDGDHVFEDLGKAGSVLNQGELSTGIGGYVALIAPRVVNEGSITTEGGTTGLAAGNKVSLDFYGDQLVNLTVDQGAIDALVENRSLIEAAGGTVVMSASAADSLTRAVVNNSGLIEATGTITRGGRIFLTADGGDVAIDSGLDTSSEDGQGGDIVVTGDSISLSSVARVDASGATGGGDVLIGGDWQGSGDLHQATTVTMEEGASINASATNHGDGGKIVLWSDIKNKESMTSVAGTLTARGGASGGDGGAIETSGSHIDTAKVAVNAGADEGTGGLWLIDPFSYVIDITEAGNIAGTLNNGTSVTVTTTVDNSSQGSNGVDAANGGLIRVLSAITKTSGGDATLTLKSDRNMEIEDSITSTAGKLNLVLWANQNDVGQGSVAFESNNSGISHDIDITTNGGHLWIGGGSGSTTWNGMTVGDGAAHAIAAGSFTSGIQFFDQITNITTAGGSIYMAGTTDFSSHRDIRFGSDFATTIDAGSGSIELVGDNISFENDSTLETTGELSISPFGTSFVDGGNAATAFTWDGTRSGSDLDGAASLNGLIIKNVDSLGGLTLGKDGNTSKVFIDTDTSVAGDVSVYAGTIEVLDDLTAAGDILLDADTGSQLVYSGVGVTIGDATVSTTAASNGSITIDGRGGNQGATQQGVSLKANSQLTAGGTGDITITGFGGIQTSMADHHGILIEDNNGIIAGGDIVLSGNGGGSMGGGGNNDGVRLNVGKIGSDSSGSVTLNGTTNGVGSGVQDILIFGLGSEIRTGAGNDILVRGDFFGLGDNSSGPVPAARTTTIGNSTSTIGTLTFESVSDSFVDAGFTLPELTLENLGGLVLGKATNIAPVTADAALDIDGSVGIYGGDIAIKKLIDTTGGGAAGDLLLKASGHITIEELVTLDTSGGDITVWSDSNNSGEGYIQLKNNVTLNSQTAGGTSGGGDITLAGGLDSDTNGRPDGFASGVIVSGIRLGIDGTNTTAILSGGGDVSIRGNGMFDASTENYGVEAFGLLTGDSGTGRISIIGESADNSGVLFSQSRTSGTALDLQSSAISGDAIVISGTATGAGGHGISFMHDGSGKSLQATGGGDIKITGTGAGTDYGIDMRGADVLASSGDIEIHGGVRGLGNLGSSFGAKASTAVTSSSSDVTLTGDRLGYSTTSDAQFDTTGFVAIEPDSDSFSDPLTELGSGLVFASSVGGLRVGKEGNAGDLAISSPVDISGPVIVYGGRVTVDGLIDVAGAGDVDINGSYIELYNDISTDGGDVLLKSSGDIDLSNSEVQTLGGDITLWSDSDSDDEGYVGVDADSVLDSRTAADVNGGTHTTGGGHIVLAGGADGNGDGRPDGFASSSDVDGIALGLSAPTTTTFYSGGGDISVRGKRTTESGTDEYFGVVSFGSLVANSGSGTITIEGESADSQGVAFSTDMTSGLALDLESSALSGTAISITGTATNGATPTHGLDFQADSSKMLRATGGGNILLSGAGTDKGISLQSTDVLASAGDITIDGQANGVRMSGSSVGAKAGTAIASSSSDITLIGDTVAFDPTSISTLDTSGVLFIQPHSGSFSSAFDLKNTEVALGTTLGGLTLGKSGNTADITISDAKTVNGDIDVLGGNILLNAALTSTGVNTISLTSSGNISDGASGFVIADELALLGGNVVLDHANNNVGTLAASGVGTIDFTDNNALTIGVVGAVGGVTASGAVDISTLVGDLEIAENVSGSSVLLNAGEDTSAGTATGGNLLVSGSSSVTASAGIAQLYSGSVAGSTGLTNLIGSGSGRFRYNSDEAVTNFDAALGASGQYAIYREQPSVTVIATDVSVAYGTAPVLTTSLGGGQNGDTFGQAISSTPSIAIGGSTSSSGNYIAGVHTLTPSGAVDQLGYAIGFTDGSLTVTPKAVTTTLSSSNKEYDGATTAGLSASANGLITGDLVSTGGVGVFENKNVGTNKVVNVTGLNLSGTDAGNYMLDSTTGTTSADISQKDLTVSGIAADDKTYDGNTSATTDFSNAVYDGLVSGDDLTLSTVTGVFDNKNVGTGKTVTLSSGYSGFDGGNYNIIDQASTTASVSTKALTINLQGEGSKTYDGTTVIDLAGVTPTLAGFVSGDDISVDSGNVTGFVEKNVGLNKVVAYTGFGVTGGDSSNYHLPINSAESTGSISAKDLTISGIAAGDKIYDGNTSATTDFSSAAYGGLISGDDLALSSVTGVFDNKNAGTDKTVTLGSSYSGVDGGNYNIIDQTSALADISQKDLTVSGIAADDKTYDGNTSATTDFSSAAYGGLISGDDLALSSVTGAFDNKNVGTDKTVTLTSGYSGVDGGNYNIIDQMTTLAGISQKDLTVSGIAADDKTYDGNTLATTDFLNAVYDGLVSGDDLALSAVTGIFDNKNAGTDKTVTLGSIYSGVDEGNYNISHQTSALADISQKDLTISGIAAGDKIYDGNTSATTDFSSAVYGGLISGDDLALSSVTGAFDNKNVGTDKIVTLGSSYSGVDEGNYNIIDQMTALAGISQKDLTVSGIAAGDKVYDGNTSATTDFSNAVYDGLVSGDDLTLSTVTGAFDNKNVGTGKTVTLSSGYSGFDGGNYNIIDQASTTASVSSKTLTIDLQGEGSKTYDGTTVIDLAGVTPTLAGFVSGDDISVDSGNVTGFVDKNVGLNRFVEYTGFGVTGGDSSNYHLPINSAESTGSISAKDLTISGIAAGDKIYDGNTSATTDFSSAAYGGLISGDDLALSSVTGVFDNKNAGTDKTVTLGSSYSGVDEGNYNIIDQMTALAGISQKDLTISGIAADDKTYDGNTSATTDFSSAAYGGLISGDDLALSSVTGAFDNKNVGTDKTVTLTSGYSGVDEGNYNIIDQTSALADLSQKDLTVSGITADDKAYDGNTSATTDFSSAVYDGLVSGDDLALSSVAGTFDDKNAGTDKTVTLGSSYSGADEGNYNISHQTSALADISQKDLTISGIAAGDKIYDGNTSATTDFSGAVYDGLVSGDDLALSSVAGAFDNKNVGTDKSVTLGSSYSGDDEGNYNIIDQTSALADISQKDLTISGIAADDKTYDGNTSATTDFSSAAYGGLISGDDLALSSVTGAFDNKNVGTDKTVTLTSGYSGVDEGNYNIIDQTSALADLSQKDLTVSGITADDKAYDGNTSATTDFSSAVYDGLVSGDDLALSSVTGAFDNKNVGTDKTVTLTSGYSGVDEGNYNISDQTSALADLSQKDLTISGIAAGDKTYDGNTSATTDFSSAVYDGLVSGDDLALSSVAGTFDNKNVGTDKSVTLGSSYSGADEGNYNIIHQTSALADISQKDLTVSGIAADDKAYDGNTSATTDFSNAVYDGLVSGDDLALSSVAGTFDNKNVGDDKTVTLGSSYSGFDGGNYNIIDQASTTASISTKTLTIDLHGEGSKTYDGTAAIDLAGVTPTLSGIVSGDDISVDSGNVTGFVDKNVGLNKFVRYTGFGVGGGDSGNYFLPDNSAESTAFIDPKDLTVSGISAGDKIYDGSAAAITDFSNAALAGLISGDDLVLSSVIGAFDNKNAGSDRAVALTSTFSGVDEGNYNIIHQMTTLADISKKDLTVSGIAADDKTYDGNATATTDFSNAVYDGLVSGDDLALSTVTGAFDNKNAGTEKTVTLNSSYSGFDGGNYNIIDQASTTASVSAKTLTIDLQGEGSKTYDGTTAIDLAGVTPTLLGFVSGDDISVDSGNVTGFVDKNVGLNKFVRYTGFDVTGGDSGNYTLPESGAETTASIGAKDLTISGISAGDKTYDGNTVATVDFSNAVYSGLISGDGLSLSSVAGEFSDQNAGTGKTVSLNSSYIGDDLGNYSITDQLSTTANIDQRALEITANSESKDFDGTPYAGGNGVTYSGWVAGETVSVLGGMLSFAGSSQGAVAVGDYAITPGGLTSTNYSISYLDGALSIVGGFAEMPDLILEVGSKVDAGTQMTFTGEPAPIHVGIQDSEELLSMSGAEIGLSCTAIKTCSSADGGQCIASQNVECSE